MKTRVLIPELMDDPNLGEDLHLEALKGLQRINRWTGNATLAWRPIRALARSLGRDRLTVLDVATGAGDVPCQLCRNAAAKGLQLEIDACDISPRAIEVARQNFIRADTAVRLFQLDVLKDAIEHEYDVVMNTTFLHHLSEADAVQILRKMRAAARHQVIVVDLVRSTINWWQVWFASRLISRSKVVHFDAPQSVRAAFTLPEIRSLATRAGLQDIQLRASWPCRFVLVGGNSQ